MKYKLITFDVFSALGDIRGTFIPHLATIDAFQGKDLAAFFSLWRNKQYEYMVVHNSLEHSYMSFAEITSRTLQYALYQYDLQLDKKTSEELVHLWQNIQFWEEAHEVVQSVKDRGYLIGMLSNGDRTMLKQLANRFGIAFDYIFSAEEIQRYKPSPKMYALPYEQLKLQKGEYLHVAGSTTDILGAIAAGIPCAWSNRQQEVPLDLSYKPTYNMKNLTELLSYV